MNITTDTTVQIHVSKEDAWSRPSDSITIEFYDGDEPGQVLTLNQTAWQQLKHLIADLDDKISLMGEGPDANCRNCGNPYPDHAPTQRVVSVGRLGGFQYCPTCANWRGDLKVQA